MILFALARIITCMNPLGRAGGHNNVDLNWQAVYAEQLPRVYNFFRYRVGDGPLAEDLTATTFEKAWRSRQSYRYNLAAFSTWLFAIARNTATDYLRKRNCDVPLESVRDQSLDDPPEAIVLMHGDLERLNHLLSKLPARERELVALKYGADMTNREISRLTHLNESNVGTILCRVVQKLRSGWEKQP